MPDVRAGLIDQDPGGVGIGRVLEVVIEERLHHVAAKPGTGIAFESNQSETASIASTPVVTPWTQHEMDLLAHGVLRRKRLEQGRPAVDVFLIEQP